MEDNKNKNALTDEQLAEVSGGREYTLTDAMIQAGGYLVGQADCIVYNGEKYYDQHQRQNIDRIDMFIYKSGTGATLLIPFYNYS